MLRDVSTLLNTITWECCSIIENVSVMYVNLVPWRRERRRNVRVTDVVGSRSREQSHSSVNKTSQWQLACMFRHLHPTPQRGYKRRARANAHKFFAEEPRLCAPAYSGGTATVAMGYVSIPSFRERGLVHNQDVPCQSVMFDVRSEWLRIPMKTPLLLTPSSALRKPASPPYQSGRKEDRA